MEIHGSFDRRNLESNKTDGKSKRGEYPEMAVNEKKPRVGAIVIAVLAGLCVGAALAGLILWGISARKEPPEKEEILITSELIEERLELVQDLVSLEYHYRDVDSIERTKLKILGLSVPFTGSRIILTYGGVIKYGIDVGQIQIEVNEAAKTVLLLLPECKIISHEIPEDGIEIFDAGRSMVNPITVQDYVNFRMAKKSEMEEHTVATGLMRNAREQAASALTAFLTSLPGMENYYLIIR